MEMEVKYLLKNALEEVESRVRRVYPEIEYVGELSLPAIYFDTEDLKFERARMALRIRKEQGKWIGCFKGETGQERVFVEEEIELTDKEKDQNNWYTQLDNLEEIQRAAAGGEIAARVKIDTRRKVYLLGSEGLVVEVVFDWVNYLEGVAQEERLELELKKGDFEDFNKLVQEFERKVGGLQETRGSKYKTAVSLLRQM